MKANKWFISFRKKTILIFQLIPLCLFGFFFVFFNKLWFVCRVLLVHLVKTARREKMEQR